MEIEHIRNKKTSILWGWGVIANLFHFSYLGWMGRIFFFESELICKYNIKDVKKLVVSLTLPKAVCRISECLVIWE